MAPAGASPQQEWTPRPFDRTRPPPGGTTDADHPASPAPSVEGARAAPRRDRRAPPARAVRRRSGPGRPPGGRAARPHPGVPENRGTDGAVRLRAPLAVEAGAEARPATAVAG